MVPVHATLGILPGNLTLGSNPPYADDDSQATKHSHASKASTLTFGQNQVYEISPRRGSGERQRNAKTDSLISGPVTIASGAGQTPNAGRSSVSHETIQHQIRLHEDLTNEKDDVDEIPFKDLSFSLTGYHSSGKKKMTRSEEKQHQKALNEMSARLTKVLSDDDNKKRPAKLSMKKTTGLVQNVYISNLGILMI